MTAPQQYYGNPAQAQQYPPQEPQQYQQQAPAGYGQQPQAPQQQYPPQAPAQQYAPPAQQGYGQPQAPEFYAPPAPQQQQAESAPVEDTGSFFGGAPTISFDANAGYQRGTFRGGLVLSKIISNQTKIGTGEVLRYNDGSPRKQLVVTLRTNERSDANDDGERRLFLKGDMVRAARAAFKPLGAPDVEVGGWLYVAWTDEKAAKTAGYNNQKIYTALYARPGQADPMAGQPAYSAPAPQQAPPPAQQPQYAPQQPQQAYQPPMAPPQGYAPQPPAQPQYAPPAPPQQQYQQQAPPPPAQQPQNAPDPNAGQAAPVGYNPFQ